jgi:hypothetical protein
LFKRKRDSHSGDESGGPDAEEKDAAANEEAASKASGKEAEALTVGARGSLEQWFKARTERFVGKQLKTFCNWANSQLVVCVVYRTFIGDVNNATTTDQLTVTKVTVLFSCEGCCLVITNAIKAPITEPVL